MRRFFLLSLLPALVLLVAPGCPLDIRVRCDEPGDCPQDFVCVRGDCEPATPERIGAACDTAAHCGPGLTCGTGFPGGYCLLACSEATPCPQGSVCATELGQCLRTCGETCTRPGYGCGPVPNASGPLRACVPVTTPPDGGCTDAGCEIPDGGCTGAGCEGPDGGCTGAECEGPDGGCTGAECEGPDGGCTGQGCETPDGGCSGEGCEAPDAGCSGSGCETPDGGCSGLECESPDAGCSGPSCEPPDAGCSGPGCESPDAGCSGPGCESPDAGCTGTGCGQPDAGCASTVPVGGACTRPCECADAAAACVSGTCTLTCSTDFTCRDGRRCTDGQCVVGARIGEPCRDTFDCPDFASCPRERMRCEERCNPGSGLCEAGYQCAPDSVCVQACSGSPASVGDDCENSLDCSPCSVCLTSGAALRCRQPCRLDRDCPGGAAGSCEQVGSTRACRL
ncbi:DUF7107 domain-containing protein [Myxococcus hansupus]|uniref:DUF7107 domain-containing protein n=1 Tax=Pseudomyxococcus hansupus TaxID=1297742 RepID=UPI000A6FEF19